LTRLDFAGGFFACFEPDPSFDDGSWSLDSSMAEFKVAASFARLARVILADMLTSERPVGGERNSTRDGFRKRSGEKCFDVEFKYDEAGAKRESAGVIA